ncbi:MlaA family lipoprotein [Luteimonas abyssi]|uniref:MlaA family lipoprotein n=1 Tax=Luteimonas abyssi TaxID=1247514 RepID=UPI000737B65E|nr:VacJ family lipoprotein [Luteimonas abyssi]
MQPARLVLPALLLTTLAACAGGQQNARSSAPADAYDAVPAHDAGPVASAADAYAPPPDGTANDVPPLDADLAAEAQAEGAYRPDAGGEPVLAPTQEELDFAEIYGEAPYDPSRPEGAQGGVAYDPWEPFNRRMHSFNNVVDRAIARPLARGYVTVVPRPARLGVTNFFSNLGQPVSALNALLQGKPKEAGQALGRFVLNFTLGIGGIFDPASDAGIPFRSEDFGQTLGVWGWENSRYLELPFFGPRTVRDTFGLAGDAPLSPVRQIDDDGTRYALQGLQLVDVRAQLFVVDRMREGAADEYALIRDAWMQRRQYQIFGDREGDENLPDYLLDDEAMPTVPADAIPMIPGSN